MDNKTYVDVRWDLAKALYAKGYVPDFHADAPSPREITWNYKLSSGIGGLRSYYPKILMTCGETKEELINTMIRMIGEEAKLYQDALAGQGYVNIVRGFQVVIKPGRVPLMPEEEFWTASFQYYPARKDVECTGWKTKEIIRPVG